MHGWIKRRRDVPISGFCQFLPKVGPLTKTKHALHCCRICTFGTSCIPLFRVSWGAYYTSFHEAATTNHDRLLLRPTQSPQTKFLLKSNRENFPHFLSSSLLSPRLPPPPLRVGAVEGEESGPERGFLPWVAPARQGTIFKQKFRIFVW